MRNATPSDPVENLDRDHYVREIAELKREGLDVWYIRPDTLGSRKPSEFLRLLSAAWETALDCIDNRESPARCLSCQTSDYELIPNYREDERIPPFAHPSCGGMFECSGCAYPQYIDFLWLDTEGRHFNPDSPVT